MTRSRTCWKASSQPKKGDEEAAFNRYLEYLESDADDANENMVNWCSTELAMLTANSADPIQRYEELKQFELLQTVVNNLIALDRWNEMETLLEKYSKSSSIAPRMMALNQAKLHRHHGRLDEAIQTLSDPPQDKDERYLEIWVDALLAEILLERGEFKTVLSKRDTETLESLYKAIESAIENSLRYEFFDSLITAGEEAGISEELLAFTRLNHAVLASDDEKVGRRGVDLLSKVRRHSTAFPRKPIL